MNLFAEKEEVAVLAGGYDGANILHSVEIFSPDGNCNMRLPSLPEAVYGLGIFFVNGTLYACGGHLKSCFVLSKEPRLKWIDSKKLEMSSSRLLGKIMITFQTY